MGASGSLKIFRLSLAVCMTAAWAGLSVGGEGGTPPGGQQPENPPEKKERFVYEPRNRRDPFVFTREVVFVDEAPARRPMPGIDTTGKTPVEVEKGLTKEQLEAIVFKAMSSVREAETLMENNAYANAIKACDDGLRELEKGKEDARIAEIRERLLRLRKAADRLRLRREAEIDFKGKDLQVTGIVARERKPQVLINNHVLTKGSTIPGTEAQIEEIRPGLIICRYKGFKVKLQP